jgi:transcriptional regulator with XRE-family HTH domain
MPAKTIPFEDALDKWMQDPEFRVEYEALEPYYRAACLRIERGLTQAELAERVGTRQPNIARFESGRHDSNLSFLRRVAKAMGYRIEIRWVREDGAPVLHEEPSQCTLERAPGRVAEVEPGEQERPDDTGQHGH